MTAPPPSDTDTLIALAAQLGYTVGYPENEEEHAFLGSDAAVLIRDRRWILLSERLQPGAHTNVVLIHEVGHAFQGDYSIMENGERATSHLDLERDAWARAERLLGGLSLRLSRRYFEEERDRALRVSDVRGF